MSEDQLRAEVAETSRTVRELARQIGGLGNKFGTFTEGLMWPSLKRILFDHFDCDTVAPVTIKRRRTDGREMEIDMLGYSNGEANKVVVVEMKSHLTEQDLDQFEENLRRFGEFFPEHRGKSLEGVIAAVGIKEPMTDRVLRRGFHLAKADDEAFALADPEGFVPRRFTV